MELVPALGFAAPFCTSGEVSSDRCAGVAGGGGLGFLALWRVSPHFAWGGGFDIVAFTSDPPRNLGLEKTSAGGAFLGLVGRAYLRDEGSFDPFFELGLGGAALGTSALEPSQITGHSEQLRYEETTAGGAMRLETGFDFFVSRRLRLGPTIGYTKVFASRIRRCRAGGQEDCEDRSTADYGHLSSFLRINLALSILLGSEL